MYLADHLRIFRPYACTLSMLCILFLAPDSTDAACPLRPTGQAGDTNFGVSAVLAGDLNHDGFPDFAVGAAGVGTVVTGRVYVYFGGPAVDETADLVLTGEASGDQFGFALAGLGDLNGDTYPDLAVGAYGHDSGGADRGRVYLFFGGPTFDATADLVLGGQAAGERFGRSLAIAGDLNDDGFDDLVVGAPLAASESGRAYVFFGGPGLDGTPDVTITGSNYEHLGHTVARAGDLNGDGHADLTVGAPFRGQEFGHVYVYWGGPALDGNADLTLIGDQWYSHFGEGLAGGDVNGDGYSDILVGSPRRGNGAGGVHVFFGGATVDRNRDLFLTAGPGPDSLGVAIAAGADVDHDGHGDLIVGASGVDFQAGRVFIYRGGPVLDTTVDQVLSGVGPYDIFGHSVAGVAGQDVTGDGRDDVVVGAPRDRRAGFNVGGAFLRFPPCVELACAPDTVVTPGDVVVRRFCVTNCDGEPHSYTYSIQDSQGWTEPGSGSLDLQPGEAACVDASVAVPLDAACLRFTDVACKVYVEGCAEPAVACEARVTRAIRPPVVSCVPDTAVHAGADLDLVFCFRNPNPMAQDYAYFTDPTPWCPGIDGSVHLGAGDSTCVAVPCAVSATDTCGTENLLNFFAEPLCTYEDQRCSTLISIMCPTGVEIAELSAEVEDGRVRLGWTLPSSMLQGVVRLHVERAQTELGPWAERARQWPSESGTFEDDVPQEGGPWWYRLALESEDGAWRTTGAVRVEFAIVSRRSGLDAVTLAAGGRAALVHYHIGPSLQATQLDVHDVAGRRVRTLVRDAREAGAYVATWDGCDEAGTKVARGVYLVQLRAGGVQATRKIVLVRP